MFNSLKFIFLALIFISCTDTSIDGLEEEVPFVISGRVYDVFEGDTLFNEGVEIAIEGKAFYTNSDGEFSISDLEKEKSTYELSIGSKYHESVDTVIDLSNINEVFIDIKLESTLLDIAPLKLGNEWKYSISYSSLVYATEESNVEKGEIRYRIINVEEENDKLIYTFDKIFKGFYLRNQDTTFVEKQGTLKISESKETSVLSFISSSPEKFFHNPISIPSGPVDFEATIIIGVDNGSNWGYIPMRRFIPYSRVSPEVGLYTDLSEGSAFIATFGEEGGETRVDSSLVSYNNSWSGHTGKGFSLKNLISLISNQ